jgi:hypothetical protein
MKASHEFFQETRAEWREHERNGKRISCSPKRQRENVEAKRVTHVRKIERRAKEERWRIPQYL